MESTFPSDFQRLTDHDPYPWQSRLYKRFCQGDIPAAIDVPTGLGKTSVIPIWLLAQQANSIAVPRRLIYVVNRRTIVDQATEEAERLRHRLNHQHGPMQLRVSTLRGQLADNGEWLEDPTVPAVIVGTIDMIGSRLLFNGYRTGKWQRSRHAGLLGQDALIVHDEAHLSAPFQKLIEWVAGRQPEGNRRLRVMAMSATSADATASVLRIEPDDRKIATAKLRAVKHVHVHRADADKDLAAQLANLATRDRGRPCRIIIFVRTPELAKNVRGKLMDKPHRVAAGCVELLTGTIRGHERDDLVEKPVLRHLLRGWDQDEPRTEYLVATSAGEVGADFDADHLVCDLSTLDAMVQRFGRVNRRGGAGREARIDVVMDRPEAKAKKGGAVTGMTPVNQARLACANFLEALPQDQNDGLNGSPEAITGNPEDGRLGWRDRPGYAPACAPPVPTVVPHDAVLDAWSLTSIQDDWPLAQEVDSYVHGLEDELPQTFVAWRAELDYLMVARTGDIDPTPVRQTLEHYRLRPQELLHDRLDRVAALLVAIRQRCGDRPVVIVAGRKVEVRRLADLSEDPKRLEGEIRDRTIILPTSVGGLDRGMIAPGSETMVTDVADEPLSSRARVLLRRDDASQWTARGLLAGVPPGDEGEPHESYPKWTVARDTLAQELKLRYLAQVVLASDEEGPQNLLLLFGERAQKERQGAPLTVEEHNKDVLRTIDRRIRALGIDQDSIEAKALRFAALHHDLGKDWESAGGRWQRAIGNPEGSPSWAKSLGKGLNVRLLAGYRHELGSFLRAIDCDALRSFDQATRDLALHLIAAHHGRGRPDFSDAAMGVSRQDHQVALDPGDIARRFDRLQRKYGHWGLAWLESILMSADVEASRQREALPMEDEDEEVKQ